MNELSSLYCRYNGLMLGVIYLINALPLKKHRFPVHRRRILEFLTEIGVNARFPRSRNAFIWRHNEIGEPLGMDIAQKSKELVDFFLLGMMSVNAVVHRLHDDRLRESEEALHTFSRRTDFGTAWQIGLLRDAAKQFQHHPKHFDVDSLLTITYGLLNTVISAVKPEPHTCFVAMPFSEPFASYYASFYRPLLDQMGYRSIRAWDGVGGEYYLESLRLLMRKCGLVLADLTQVGSTNAPNQNVLIEIGMARGVGRTTFLIGQTDKLSVPSNLDGDVLGEYSPTREGWPETSIEDCAFAFRIRKVALDVDPSVVRTKLKFGAQFDMRTITK